MSAELVSLVLLGLGYLSALFATASAVERGWIPRRLVHHPLIGILALGVYANAPTIDRCRGRGLGRYFWQHDWGSGGRLNPAAAIHQKAGKQWAVGGVMSDINDVYSVDYGQWEPVDLVGMAQAAAGSLA